MERLTDTDRLAAVIIDTMKFKDNETDKYVETKAVKMEPGERMDLSMIDNETGEELKLKPVTVTSLTGAMPMGVMTLGKTAGFHIIMSKEVFDKLIEGN